MMKDDRLEENFGCEHCWPPVADAAWEARGVLAFVAELIDESHFHVRILACPRCAQRFVSVFNEMINWVGGSDPQYWTRLPLTKAEAADLVQQGDSFTETELYALGPGRRSLQRGCPARAKEWISWGTGIPLILHD